jgi:hypothetical protein
MNKRHEIQFKSYDRLFPSQDTMPKGGLGNLIALPLQKRQGRSSIVNLLMSITNPTRTNGHFYPPSKEFRKADLKKLFPSLVMVMNWVY